MTSQTSAKPFATRTDDADSRLLWWQMQHCIRLIAPDEHAPLWMHALRHIRESKAGLYMGWIIFVFCVVDLVTSPSLTDVMMTTRFAVGVFVCVIACGAYQESVGKLCWCFRRIADTAIVVETQLPSTETKECMARAARRDVLCTRFFLIYSLLLTVAALADRKMMAEPRCVFRTFHALFGESFTLDVVVECVLFVAYTYGAACTTTACNMLLGIVVSVMQAAAELHTAVGLTVAIEHCSSRLASLQSAALRCTDTGDRVLAYSFFSVLTCCLVMPLIGTVLIVTHGFQHGVVFSLSFLSLIPVWVILPCEAGNFLNSAKLHVSYQAYCGPWLEETVAQRKVRLGMIQSAQGRPLFFNSGSDFVQLNRMTCMSLLKGWYSSVQFLINVTRQ